MVFFRKKRKSANMAAERLISVLVEDRIGVSQNTLALIKKEIYQVLRKYMDLDPTEMEVKVVARQNKETGRRPSSLVADIPIKRLKKK